MYSFSKSCSSGDITSDVVAVTDLIPRLRYAEKTSKSRVMNNLQWLVIKRSVRGRSLCYFHCALGVSRHLIPIFRSLLQK